MAYLTTLRAFVRVARLLCQSCLLSLVGIDWFVFDCAWIFFPFVWSIYHDSTTVSCAFTTISAHIVYWYDSTIACVWGSVYVERPNAPWITAISSPDVAVDKTFFIIFSVPFSCLLVVLSGFLPATGTKYVISNLYVNYVEASEVMMVNSATNYSKSN